ncbi:MAG: histidine kinase [Desulfobacteraceae bacterium 4572_187]|nr:MAG: histidine kinase [Desulfobacteraceae bacterium 4572_187]
MADSVSFQTRARTIDHLGREQIADCPTAISELWKNAFDAYARNVELHIFDGNIPVAALVDDGHGMNRKELEEKWLIIGTESKTGEEDISKEERDGLDFRPKQGQKGIGRLSCAALGHLLLLISKRNDHPFSATLLDWRLFENPFLMLNDIQVPMVEFENKNEIFDHLPSLFDKLMENLWGDGNSAARDGRLETGWELYEELEQKENKESTKKQIEETVINDSFFERHLSAWDVWTGKSLKGTAMFIAGLHDDLIAQLSFDAISESEGPDARAKENFIQTLSNFTDPFAKEGEPEITDFTTSVIAWNGQLRRPVIDAIREFDISNLDALEHIVEGNVDEEGFFKGKIKAFGHWHEDIVIKPAKKYKTRKDSKFGPFQIRVGSFEAEKRKTTLPHDFHNQLEEQAQRYGGFRVYRDSLRVMPYGREDNDYFEIEKRRTLNAGRYFWSNRRLFGRIAITRKNNPNLKDKAGREGLLDNRAAKLLREIVLKILIDSADRFFGRKSDRELKLKDIYAEKAEEKAEQDRKKLLQKERKRIKASIKKNQKELSDTLSELIALHEQIQEELYFDSAETARDIKNKIGDYIFKLSNFSLTPVPSSLGSIEKEYRMYRELELTAKELIKQLDSSANAALEKFNKTSDSDIAQSVFRSKAGHLQSRIRKWSKEGRKILQEELNSFNQLVDERNKAFHNAMSDLLEDLRLERIELTYVLGRMDEEFEKQDIENIQRLQPYLTALQSIREQIDLEGLAIHSMNESSKWKKEAEKLNSLAQLGITVEIIGHEIEGLDLTMDRGLKALKDASFDNNQSQAYQDAIFAHQGLSDRWRFLSPLKLSGEKTKSELTGEGIFQYVKKFFGDAFKRKQINFHITDTFKKIRLYEQPARIYPVFINIVNNARYWVTQDENSNREILIDFRDGEIIVSDNGPGVERDDIEQLFTLFFTRKQRGGRGVGLYLCRTNLQAGGHKIRYETIKEKQILNGANFVLEMNGIKYE